MEIRPELKKRTLPLEQYCALIDPGRPSKRPSTGSPWNGDVAALTTRLRLMSDIQLRKYIKLYKAKFAAPGINSGRLVILGGCAGSITLTPVPPHVNTSTKAYALPPGTKLPDGVPFTVTPSPGTRALPAGYLLISPTVPSSTVQTQHSTSD
jgi:hypothetical protein